MTLTEVLNMLDGYSIDTSKYGIFERLVQKNAMINMAFTLAEKAYNGEMRKDGTPAINHPLEVAWLTQAFSQVESTKLRLSRIYQTLKQSPIIKSLAGVMIGVPYLVAAITKDFTLLEAVAYHAALFSSFAVLSLGFAGFMGRYLTDHMHVYSISDEFSNLELAVAGAILHDMIEMIMEPYYKNKPDAAMSREDYQDYWKGRARFEAQVDPDVFYIVSKVTRKFKLDRVIELYDDVVNYLDKNGLTIDSFLEIYQYKKPRDWLLRPKMPMQNYTAWAICTIANYTNQADEQEVLSAQLIPLLSPSEMRDLGDGFSTVQKVIENARKSGQGVPRKTTAAEGLALLDAFPMLGTRESYDMFMFWLRMIHEEREEPDQLSQHIKRPDILHNLSTLSGFAEERRMSQSLKYLSLKLVREIDPRYCNPDAYWKNLRNLVNQSPAYKIYEQVLLGLYGHYPPMYQLRFKMGALLGDFGQYAPDEGIPRLIYQAVSGLREITAEREVSAYIDYEKAHIWQAIAPILVRVGQADGDRDFTLDDAIVIIKQMYGVLGFHIEF